MTQSFFPVKRKPLKNTIIFIADPTNPYGFILDEWMDSDTDNMRLNRNLVYLTEQEAKSATEYMRAYVKKIGKYLIL
ncbi:hypothetical protein [Snodgrassella alvi]|nr:hypothetical protein [Snodgrassella alvi]